jgi:hypothetical protein
MHVTNFNTFKDHCINLQIHLNNFSYMIKIMSQQMFNHNMNY